MSTTPISAATESDPRRWRALAVLGLIQFMLVVDVSIVNVALPHIQRDLHFSHAGLAWVVNGYVVMAGGLLLLGGASRTCSGADGCSSRASPSSRRRRRRAAPPPRRRC